MPADRGDTSPAPDALEDGVRETGGESIEALVGRTVAEARRPTEITRADARRLKDAPLRIYLGAAPGVGKTYAMLSEAHRRLDRGTDVVVGCAETYGRPSTQAMLEGLEQVSTRTLEYRGTSFEELDPEAMIARHPEVAVVDELAHTNIPGSGRTKRWEDVIDILSHGIEVITTLNVQHIESLNDVIANVTGIKQRETVPDWIVDLADQVELVDMSAHALRRRMMHGNVYPDQRKAELALRRFFTTENLSALRELALMRVADQVDDALLERWSGSRTPETRERVLVCVSRPELAEELVRRGARIAQRARGEFIVAHVRGGGRDGSADAWIDPIEKLALDLGGTFELITSEEPVDSVLAFAYQRFVTQIVVGEPLRPRWQELIRGSFVSRLIRQAENIDIHVIARRTR
jgi:two-component system sensor histidine kinase KdpD